MRSSSGPGARLRRDTRDPGHRRWLGRRLDVDQPEVGSGPGPAPYSAGDVSEARLGRSTDAEPVGERVRGWSRRPARTSPGRPGRAGGRRGRAAAAGSRRPTAPVPASRTLSAIASSAVRTVSGQTAASRAEASGHDQPGEHQQPAVDPESPAHRRPVHPHAPRITSRPSAARHGPRRAPGARRPRQVTRADPSTAPPSTSPAAAHGQSGTAAGTGAAPRSERTISGASTHEAADADGEAEEQQRHQEGRVLGQQQPPGAAAGAGPERGGGSARPPGAVGRRR